MKKISRIATVLVALALVVATLALPTSAYAATKASRRQQLKTSTKSELDDWVDYAKGHGWKISKRVKYNKYSSTITLKVKRSGPSRRMKVTIKLSQPKRGKTKIKLYLKPSSHARRRRVTRNELWAMLR